MKNLKIRNIFFVLGGPGSGKGTFCSNIIKNVKNVNHLSAGALLRKFTKKSEIQKDSEEFRLASEINEIIKQGKIVPVK